MARDRDLDSRRLKAARALRAVSVADLAGSDVLKQNGISTNLIGETERKERDARPMELRVIAEALRLPVWFFETELSADHEAPPDLANRLEQIERKIDLLLLHAGLIQDGPTEEPEIPRYPRRQPPEDQQQAG